MIDYIFQLSDSYRAPGNTRHCARDPGGGEEEQHKAVPAIQKHLLNWEQGKKLEETSPTGTVALILQQPQVHQAQCWEWKIFCLSFIRAQQVNTTNHVLQMRKQGKKLCNCPGDTTFLNNVPKTGL